MNKKRLFLIVGLVLVLGSLLAGTIWLAIPRPALPEAFEALKSDELVEVSLDPWIRFSPAETPTTGFIFYPGGRVDPRAYAVLMRAIASEGYLVILPEMPLDLAVLNTEIAGQIILAYPDIQSWVIGGHSLGGSMASQYASEHPDEIQGLVLWASYPVDNADLVDGYLKALLVYGSLDTGSNDPVIEQKKILLPESTTYVRIEGGNHHQFGDYIDDSQDPLPTISRADQQEIILESTLDFLKELSK